jgi:hypothetical protein
MVTINTQLPHRTGLTMFTFNANTWPHCTFQALNRGTSKNKSNTILGYVFSSLPYNSFLFLMTRKIYSNFIPDYGKLEPSLIQITAT